MKGLWLAGFACAVKTWHRFEEMFVKARPQWEFPGHRSIRGPAAAWAEGWVAPGSQVQADRRLRWLNSDFAWEAPALATRPGARPQCHHVHAGEEILECYTPSYTGFYWGRPARVSEHQSCLARHCLLLAQASCEIRYTTDPGVAWATPAFLDLVRVAKPPLLQSGLVFNSSHDFSLLLQGPAHGYVWFKPLLWASSGWYSKITLRGNHSFVQSFQLEIRFPVAFKRQAEGVFFVSKRS